MTLAELIASYRIRATATRIASNPNMAGDDWSRSASHWRVCLYSGATRRAYTVYFSLGAAHTGEPRVPDVLSSLRLDASASGSGSFEEWAADMGMDVDSRQAKRTRRACLACAAGLRRWLGLEGFDHLLLADDE